MKTRFNTRQYVLVAALAGAFASGALFSGSVVWGQQNGQPNDEKTFVNEIRLAESNLAIGGQPLLAGVKQLSQINHKATTNETQASLVAEEAVLSYYAGSDSKAPIRLQALQIAQNQKLIEQNARIIELLEQQAGKK